MKLILSTIVAGVAGLALAASTAKANFIAVYASNAGSVYTYTLRFTVDQVGEVLKSGDTVTLYDVPTSTNVADIVSAVQPTSPAGQFTVTQQLTGITPADLVGAPGITDSATVQNITFMYTGADRTVSTDFTGALITMAPAYTTLRVGKESGSTHITFPLNPPSTTTDTSIRSVLLPATDGGTLQTPEPASLAVMGLAAAGLLARRRKA